MTTGARRGLFVSGALAALVGAAPRARAADDDAPPPAATIPAAPADDGGASPAEASPDDLEQRIHDLEQRLADTQDLVQRRKPAVTLSGYVDFGFFAAQGDGTGVIQDVGPASARYFPQYASPNYGWVFLGDLLAPAINSRGEAADLGDLPGVTRFDGVHSHGAPGFIVNEVNLTLTAAVAESALATASVDFLPRSGTNFSLGDVFEVDLAQLEWMVGPARKTSLFVGKMESVLGIEYRDRKASQRFGITPSLIARYTTGTPLGVKVRSKLGDDDQLVLAAALTNGSSTIEQFHFYDEIDSNAGKTVSGRAGFSPVPALELGVSGEYGPQDHALDSANPLWFVGVDLQAHLGRLEVKGQWLHGHGTGETNLVYDDANRPYGLALHEGGYLEGDLMLTPSLGVLARGDLRDAEVWLGDIAKPSVERLYITRGWRATVGARWVANEHVVVKAEVLHNGEYGGIPVIRDDVFTSSLVLSY